MTFAEFVVDYQRFNARLSQLDRACLDLFGLPIAQCIVLKAISDGANQPNCVASAIGAQSQTVTGALDRLERKGYIVRERDPHYGDRRAVFLTLTALGTSTAATIALHIDSVVANA